MLKKELTVVKEEISSPSKKVYSKNYAERKFSFNIPSIKKRATLKESKFGRFSHVL